MKTNKKENQWETTNYWCVKDVRLESFSRTMIHEFFCFLHNSLNFQVNTDHILYETTQFLHQTSTVIP